MRALLETRSQTFVGFGLPDCWAFHPKIALEASWAAFTDILHFLARVSVNQTAKGCRGHNSFPLLRPCPEIYCTEPQLPPSSRRLLCTALLSTLSTYNIH